MKSLLSFTILSLALVLLGGCAGGGGPLGGGPETSATQNFVTSPADAPPMVGVGPGQ